MADIPGRLGRGNWTVALFVDDKAPGQAVRALTWIMKAHQDLEGRNTTGSTILLP